ncbi:MAG TPA: glycosyltransferase family 4 protein [Trichocoleus sp.]
MTLSESRNKFNQAGYLSHSVSAESIKRQAEQLPQPIHLEIITQFFPPDFAATGQLIEELVKQFAQQGISVTVFTGQPGYAFQTATAPNLEKQDKIRIRRSRAAQLFPQRIRGKALNGVVFAIRAALHLFKSVRYHNVLLLTTAPPFLPLIGYFAKKLFNIPYVCILYDLYPDIAIKLDVIPQNHKLAKIWRSINCRVWRNAEQLIVLSPEMKQQIAATCPDVLDKISVIHSWADPSQIAPIEKQKNWFAWKHQLVNRFTVLYSGNMGRCHDVDTLLKAASLLRDEPIQFVCVGGGAKRRLLIEQVEQAGLKNFLFLPYQDKEVLPYSLTACDLSLVSVSAGMEKLVAPSKLYPALAAGRPIAAVCSRKSYLNELIADAECGATFENGDAAGLAQFIRLLSRDQQLTQQMGKAGRQYLQANFTPEIIAQQYVEVLEQSILP